MLNTILTGSFIEAGGLIFTLLYFLLIIGVCIQIISDTTSPSKTIGYLLLIIFLPLLGVVLYLSIGVNYRNRRMYSKKITNDEDLEEQLLKYTQNLKREAMGSGNPVLEQYKGLAYNIASENVHWLSCYNNITLFKNGEEKFPAVLEAIENAKDSIHIEYYIVRNDQIGNAIKEALIRKAKEGVKVRFIYDDYGGKEVRRKYSKELRAAGVEVYPFRKILFIFWANRLNYRNHRKIIVVDGKVGFVGGINIGDEYINTPGQEKEYLRDTHIKLEGYSCYALQHIFLSDWNFCARQNLEPTEALFPPIDKGDFCSKTVQIVASGPDSREPLIMHSILQAIALSKKEVLITTPYFIPSESVLTMLKIAARSQVKVKILVPEKTNSWPVRMASRALYRNLFEAGVEIYHYHRGFIHAKTSVFDRSVAMIGTANMDNRSFDLNFEVNAVVYDKEVAEEMTELFYRDLEHATRVDPIEWRKRSKVRDFFEKVVYLASSLL